MDNAPDHAAHATELSLPVMLAIGGAAIAAGIVLAPYVVPAIGLGNINIAESTLSAMHNLPAGSGLALQLNQALSYIPFIGSELAKGGINNILATAVTGLGGVMLGSWVSKNHDGKAGIDWGTIIKWGALATSALIALPSILTGVSNGLIYMINEMTAAGLIDPGITGKSLAQSIVDTIGTIPYQEPVKSGLTGAAVTLPHLLTCGSSMFPLAASFGANELWTPADPARPYVAQDTKGNPLPPEDPNHHMTKEEVALMERYNQAPPAQKILLKKEIMEQGYDPDFHANGTMHLYKHSHLASSNDGVRSL